MITPADMRDVTFLNSTQVDYDLSDLEVLSLDPSLRASKEKEHLVESAPTGHQVQQHCHAILALLVVVDQPDFGLERFSVPGCLEIVVFFALARACFTAGISTIVP